VLPGLTHRFLNLCHTVLSDLPQTAETTCFDALEVSTLQLVGKLVATKLWSPGRGGHRLSWLERSLCRARGTASSEDRAASSCLFLPEPGALAGLCCWLELAQKTGTLRGLFEENLNIFPSLKPSVCWSNYIAYTPQIVCVQLMADPLTKLEEESRSALVQQGAEFITQ